MNKRIISAVAGLSIIAAGMFALLGSASAVETSGVIYGCRNAYTGALTIVNSPAQCPASYTTYEIEGQIYVPPTATPVP